MEGEVFEEKPFGRRRIYINDFMDDFFFDRAYSEVMGAARNAKMGQVVNLDVRKKIADLELSSMPHLGSGIIFKYQGRDVMVTPHMRENVVSVIDMENGQKNQNVRSGFFYAQLRKHPYAWVNVFFDKHRGVMHVIDKKTLEIVKTIKPEPGKTAAHAEFTLDGQYVLISVWDMSGTLPIYNVKTLKEVKRVPMKTSSGKYNVFNKINLSEGTSH